MYKAFCAVLAWIIGSLSVLGIQVRADEIGRNTLVWSAVPFTVIEKAACYAEFENQAVNTLEIEFESAQEAEITISNGSEVIYSRSAFEQTRFCAFDTVVTDRLKIVIKATAKVESMELSLKQSVNGDFRVTAYVVAKSIVNPAVLSSNSFDVVTDAILFGVATFDENGELIIDYELLETSLSNLRAAVGERPVNIYLNFLGPNAVGEFADWNEMIADKGARHTSAFRSRKLEKSIPELLDEYDFDGVFFDYEYPISTANWNAFNNFVCRLDKNTDKLIGAAAAYWDMGFSYSAYKALDMIEMMQYDMFDAVGNHASFDAAVIGYNSARDTFIPLEKFDLGVPFYARPVDRSEFWHAYNQFADELGRNKDGTMVDGKMSYFNSWQTIYDKTAFAMSKGMGGMMVWHYACDITDVENELSLFGAMDSCISDRLVRGVQ